MIGQRIKRLREAHRESQRELGQAIGRDKSVISKWESGAVQVDLEMAARVAKRYGVSLSEVLDLESDATGNAPPPGLAEDCHPYIAGPGDPLAALQGPNRYQFTVDTDVLERLGIRIGDVVTIDDSAEACGAVKALQGVQVSWNDPVDGKSKLLLRQFVPPSLLITNGPANQPSIDLSAGDRAFIVGVIVSSHRSFSA